MFIYRCDIMLMEATFFSSREIGKMHLTEPFLGNYALTYAFGLAQSPYDNDGTVFYAQHLDALNQEQIYVTPGTFTTDPQFLLRKFNVQPDAYRSVYGQGFIATPPPHGTLRKRGQKWDAMQNGERVNTFRAINRPQEGRLRLLASGNAAVCYVQSESSLHLPRYIRLGKFMSKARVDVTEMHHESIDDSIQTVEVLLNPADLPAGSDLLMYDLMNVPPTPLVRNARLQGDFYHLQDGAWLPRGCAFQVVL